MEDLIELFKNTNKDVEEEMEKVDKEIINLVVDDGEEKRKK